MTIADGFRDLGGAPAVDEDCRFSQYEQAGGDPATKVAGWNSTKPACAG
jgi:hypothetical protein